MENLTGSSQGWRRGANPASPVDGGVITGAPDVVADDTTGRDGACVLLRVPLPMPPSTAWIAAGFCTCCGMSSGTTGVAAGAEGTLVAVAVGPPGVVTTAACTSTAPTSQTDVPFPSPSAGRGK